MDDHRLYLSHSRRDQGDDVPIVRRDAGFREDFRSAHPEVDFQSLAYKMHRRQYGLDDGDSWAKLIPAKRVQ